eukprot:TRINITY_DN15283_c0_g1_i2.p1 TRINITY_DN15283_c0_g1~~TRINITY_DN15283_c0_g1_i2.p1  ORF type:complete len:131 (-),score=33.08 TRINITY_DN15283_c0_g1_i2:335-727(-)
MRGIDIKDTELFFHMIRTTTGADEIDLEAFVGSCLRVKGDATSIDLHTLAFENKMMFQQQKRFYTFAEQRFNSLDEKLSKVGIYMRDEATQKRIHRLEKAVMASKRQELRPADWDGPSAGIKPEIYTAYL